jgi:hypothetical protein
VRGSGAAPTLDPATTDITTIREGGRGMPVSVEVRSENLVRVPFVGWLLGDAIQLHAAAVMRQEFG